MTAYDHSFLPSAIGRYIIQLVSDGWDLERAQVQGAIEHGQEQAEEIARLLDIEMLLFRVNRRDRRSLIPALRRAVRKAEIIEARRESGG
jgi:hypothetical protein